MATDPISTFDENIRSVSRLMNFDRDVQDIAIEQLEQLHKTLVEVERISNEQRNGKRTLEILRSIRANDSLRSRYQLIFNQSVVLLVSHFGSALGDLFRLAVAIGVEKGDRRILSEELSLDVEELLSRGEQIHEILGDLLILKKDISFQDMQSVHRAFKKYFGIEMKRDTTVNDIIVGQACRHAIVHDGGRANTRIVRQIADAKPRSLKPDVKENEQLLFTPEEVEELSRHMREYTKILLDRIMRYKKASA